MARAQAFEGGTLVIFRLIYVKNIECEIIPSNNITQEYMRITVAMYRKSVELNFEIFLLAGYSILRSISTLSTLSPAYKFGYNEHPPLTSSFFLYRFTRCKQEPV